MLPGQKQTVWQLPAVLNLTLGGMGTGFYLVALLLILPQNAELAQTAMFKLLGPVLVGVGLLSLTTEAGHPLNSIYLLTNLRYSWMSREALAGGIFIVAAGLDWLMPNPVLQGIAALAGLVFIIAQGMMVWRASGVVTWNTPIVPWFFLTCGLVTGGGLVLVISNLLATNSWVSLPLVALVATIANAVVWMIYLNTPGEIFQRGIAPLKQTSHIAFALGVGHLLPIALLISALATPQPLAALSAGLALIFGGVMQKFAFAFQASAMRSVIHN